MRKNKNFKMTNNNTKENMSVKTVQQFEKGREREKENINM